MRIVPRYYQSDAVQAIDDYFIGGRGSNPLVVAPTATGKSVIIAMYIEKQLKAWPSCRFMMVTHNKELIEQNYEKLISIYPEVNAGIYSAGIGQRDTTSSAIFAGIQSVYNKSSQIGKIDVLMVDEAHMIPKTGNGMYQQFINALLELNPLLKVVGLTATPYRLIGGLLYQGKGRLFDGVCYEIPVRDMIDQGFMTPLVTPMEAMEAKFNLSDVPISGGDYVLHKLEAAVDKPDLIDATVKETIKHGVVRKSWLVFTTGIEHGTHVKDSMYVHGITCRLLTGKTPKEERAQILSDFKLGVFQCLVNVNVLTTGFDAPNIDMIVGLRPTKSTSLYIQMLGRGVRLFPSKVNCLYLDFAQNIIEHGPFDSPEVGGVLIENKGEGQAPTKSCESCGQDVHAAVKICPFCGFAFPPPEENKHSDFVSTLDVISSDQENERTYPVSSMEFHINRKAGSKDSCRVDYMKPNGVKSTSEYLCFEHDGFARRRAIIWWENVMPNHELPVTSMNAVIVLHMYGRTNIKSVTVSTKTKYKNVVRRKLNLPQEVTTQ